MPKPQRRMIREEKTFNAMLAIFCHAHHETSNGLCADCKEVQDYAQQRLTKCPFQENKPTCANCPIHCYQKEMREKTRAMMRYAGPRMIYRHPILATAHIIDSRRKGPEVRQKNEKKR
jgi:hypothetical protein